MAAGNAISWNFSKLESVLARINLIAEDKRGAFQHRLKNLHRLNFPVGFETKQGKAAVYQPGVTMMMALAIELTQLALSPETIVRTLALNWYPTFMALDMAATALGETAGPQGEASADEASPMFIYFDPLSLAGLQEGYDLGPTRNFFEFAKYPPPDLDNSDAVDQSFFYGGIGIVRENIARWTSGDSRRLSLVNVTALMRRVAESAFPGDDRASLELRLRFYRDVNAWTEKIQRDVHDGYMPFLQQWVRTCLAPAVANDDAGFDDNVDFVVANLGVRRDLVEQVLREHGEGKDVDQKA